MCKKLQLSNKVLIKNMLVKEFIWKLNNFKPFETKSNKVCIIVKVCFLYLFNIQKIGNI